MKACEELNARLKGIKDKMPGAPWKDVIQAGYNVAANLSSYKAWQTNDSQSYTIYGVSCCEVEVDVLTGNILLQRVDILEDTGESMSPLIDVGQVEGGFVMGLGYWLWENLVYQRQTGELLTNRTWLYKVPGAKDIPVDFRIAFVQKNPNPFGVLRSKATGEPAVCMACVALFAIRHAVDAARQDAGLPREWYSMPVPCLPEHLLLLMGSEINQYVL